MDWAPFPVAGEPPSAFERPRSLARDLQTHAESFHVVLNIREAFAWELRRFDLLLPVLRLEPSRRFGRRGRPGASPDGHEHKSKHGVTHDAIIAQGRRAKEVFAAIANSGVRTPRAISRSGERPACQISPGTLSAAAQTRRRSLLGSAEDGHPLVVICTRSTRGTCSRWATTPTIRATSRGVGCVPKPRQGRAEGAVVRQHLVCRAALLRPQPFIPTEPVSFRVRASSVPR